MDDKKKAVMNAKSKILKALGHPTRLYIVEELSKGEKCVCKFVDAVGVDFSTISKHLSVLREAGIVEDEKRGLQVFYKLRVPCIMNFMGCIEEVIKSNLETQMSLLK
jgi:ArsR family transcriptional regulator